MFTFLLVGGFLTAGYAKDQVRLGKLHYLNCQVTPEIIKTSIHGDIVTWDMDGAGHNETLEVRFDPGKYAMLERLKVLTPES